MSLSNVGYSVSGVDVTVTAISDVDCSSGVYGVEGVINGASTFAVDEVGAVANQTITVGANEGLQAGDTVTLTPYYDLTPFATTNTRVYGSSITTTLSGGSSGGGAFSKLGWIRNGLKIVRVGKV